MSEREHTSKQFEQQLRALKDKLLLMSHHAEKMIADAIRALVERRPSLAEEVIKSDDEMDQLELDVDNQCYEILALEQPVARDLRFIATALKIVRDIERIGDIAVNIAERAIELIQEPEMKRLIDLPIMAEAAQRILKESLDAFVNSDAELAEKVISLVGTRSKLVFKPLPQDDPRQRKPDISLADSKLKWTPKVNLDDGLRELAAWLEGQAAVDRVAQASAELAERGLAL